LWIGCGDDEYMIDGQSAIDDYRDYLQALATFIHQNSLHNVFCYEFIGEPSFFEIYNGVPSPPHTKSEICAIVNEWNNGVKYYDPDHL
jgi:hypothetical protein